MRLVATTVCLVSLTLVGACSLLQPLDGLDAGTGGAGEGGATSSSAGVGGDATTGDECAEPSDCAPPLGDCIAAACDRGYCVYSARANLSPLASQLEGNCLQKVCDGEGGEKDLFVEDPPDDGNDCTLDSCVNGEPRNAPRPPGEPCALGVCDAAAECVECLPNGRTDPSSPQCDLGELCLSGQCSPQSCTDDTVSGGESDVDCGGPCPPCGDGLLCGVGDDCLSGVCDEALEPPRCAAPTCTDGVKNGSETDVDCGSDCPACDPGRGCAVPSDCTSGVCFGGLCRAPTCTDAVTNGAESDVDCGGTDCERCLAGKRCDVDTDCAGGLRCGEGVCVDPCKDGERNYQETDVDCGGPLCAPCDDGRRCKCKTDCASKECCAENGVVTCTKSGTCRGTLPLCPIAEPQPEQL